MQISRRGFFTRVTGAVAVAALAKLVPSTVQAEERRRARGGEAKADAGGNAALNNPLVDPKSQQAQAVHYTEDKKTIKDAALKVERQGVKFDDQHCKNCSFYKEVGSKAGSKVGTCTIFAKQLVKADAWCQTWNKK